MIRRELKSQVNVLEKRIAAAVQARRDKVVASPISRIFVAKTEPTTW